MTKSQRKKIAKIIVANWCVNAEIYMFDECDIKESDAEGILFEIYNLAQGKPHIPCVREVVKHVTEKHF